MSSLRFCIYCEQQKPIAEFGVEHVLPKGLAKSAPCKAPFRTNSVCQTCNHTAGIKVDGPFIRSFLFNNEVVAGSFQHLDPKVPTPMPLAYLGIPEGASFPRNQQCEAWLTMAGCYVYHLHEYQVDSSLPMAGGHPIQRRKEPGTVYYFNNSDNRYWVTLSLMSLKKAFPGSRKIVVDIAMDKAGKDYFKIAEPELEDSEIIGTLRQFVGRSHLKFHAPMLLDFEFKLMAKMALGVGCELFGEAYYQSAHANRLREAMWASVIGAEHKKAIPGRGYLQADNKQYAQAMGWPGGFTIALTPVANHLVLLLTWFGKRLTSMAITDEFRRFRTSEMDDDGQIFVMVPQRGFWHGPEPWSRFEDYKAGRIRIKELDEARSWEVDPAILPSTRSR